MLSVLANVTYRRLFAAQVLSLLGTGLTTVALGLLAWELAGAEAGLVLGTALAIKMIAYVGIAPIAGALAGRFPRRGFLVGLDLFRAGMVLLLPFVTQVWQIYALVFLFQASSAAFTPTFQATIPDVLADEKDYTNALSLSRLAYDLESLASPMFAALALTVVSFHWLFVGNAIGFLASAALVLSATLPAALASAPQRSFRERLTRGAWIYLATPRLRGLLALSFAVASAGAMVIVNTVVVARDRLGGGEEAVAYLFAAYGLGSMLVALTLPRLLDRIEARTAMLLGGTALAVLMTLGPLAATWATALVAWTLIGAAAALVQTPSGLLLRRSSHVEDRPALFAAQFALSHVCWLATYPIGGLIGARFGLDAAFALMATGAAGGVFVALLVWPRHDPVEVEHQHEPIEHAHDALEDAHHAANVLAEGDRRRLHRHLPIRHAHAFVIDDHHPRWPRPAR